MRPVIKVSIALVHQKLIYMNCTRMSGYHSGSYKFTVAVMKDII
jgi:hypothetical protein